MSQICQTCGLPTDICACESIAKESQRIKVFNTKKKFGKIYTVISGFDKDINIKEMTKKLKSQLACGGTSKTGEIELQGQHKGKIRDFLVKSGFSEETIDIE